MNRLRGRFKLQVKTACRSDWVDLTNLYRDWWSLWKNRHEIGAEYGHLASFRIVNQFGHEIDTSQCPDR